MAIKIAFYGKGGIGKSTIASNISAALALQGKRVLHIGCDPKADSTGSLAGRRLPTVLQMLADSKDALRREDIVYPGAFGVSCVEAGGPQAGSGCAGLGISSMYQELERLGVLDENWDIIIYDVLGDVVCGGFAMPMRRHFADRIFLVTSAQYMSLYAANNIMKGIERYSGKEGMLGGIIHNRAGLPADDELVSLFAQKTNTQITGSVPETDIIKRADYLRQSVFQAAPDSYTAAIFMVLSNEVISSGVCRSAPLSDQELEELCGRYILEMESGS